MNQCECPAAGYCPLRDLQVSERVWHVCQRKPLAADLLLKSLKESATRPVLVHRPMSKAVSQIGSRLHQGIQNFVGEKPPCGDCTVAIRTLNSMTPDEVLKDLDRIVADIESRAAKQAPRFWQRLMIRVDQGIGIGVTGEVIRGLILRAVEAEAADPPPAKKEVEPWTAVYRRHLMFHLWPLKETDVWKWHVRQLAKRWRTFTGVKVLSLAVDAGTEEYSVVLDEFNRHGILWDEVIVHPNDVHVGEVATFTRKLKAIVSRGVHPGDAVFYAHGKGVRLRTDTPAIREWTRIMYEACLDYLPLIDQILQEHLFAGALKSLAAYAIPGNHRWHYSGTFYWFRLPDVMKRRPFEVEKRYIGTEAWPGRQARKDEGGSIFIDDLTHSLYHYPSVSQIVAPMWNSFQKKNHQHRTEFAMCSTWSASFARNLPRSAVRDKRVLEVGSMDVNGSCRPFIQAYGPQEYIGVDQAAGPGVDRVLDAFHLASEYGPESFDLIVCTEVLEHVENWRGFLKQLWCLLRETGYLLLTTRSAGFPFHGYPHDYWRFPLTMIPQVFSVDQIEAMVKDPTDPGIGAIIRKKWSRLTKLDDMTLDFGVTKPVVG